MAKRVVFIISAIWLFASPALGSWSFITLSDTYSGLEWGMVKRAATLYAIHKNTTIAFLISTGDFENNETIDDGFKSRLWGDGAEDYYTNPPYTNVPWFEALGNHNVDKPEDTNNVLNVLTPERIQSQLPGMTNFQLGPHDATMTYAREGSTYSFDYENAHFVILNQYYASDTGLDGEHENGGPTACVYDVWYDWLVQDLAQNKQPIIFVFGHEPAFPRGSRHCGDSLDEDDCSGNYLDWDNPARPLRDKFWELLNSHNVVAHFVGHEHTASARVIKDLSDFPGINYVGPDEYTCDEPHWNCYCNNEAKLPEIGDKDTIVPSQGVIEYNNGISRDSGHFHLIEVDGSTIRFHMYKDEDGAGTLKLVRTFTYDASSSTGGDIDIYVDNTLASDCLSTYSPATRACGAGSDSAYRSIANAMDAVNADPGDAPGKTIAIRSGTYNDVIRPQVSGSPGAPIAIKNYADEVVTITDSPYLDAEAWGDYDGYRWGIYAWSVGYITIEGIVFDNPGNGWGRFVNSNNIIVKHCTFHDAPTNGDVAGLKFVNSHHNQILNNIIDDGFDNLSFINSNYNLVEGNTVTKADHTLWAIKCGDYNIIRENYFFNEYQKTGEIYDCNDPANRDMSHHGILDVNATLHNVVEDNIFAGTAADDGGGPYNAVQLAGQYTIIRRNIFYKSEGTGIGLTYYSQEAEYDLHNRIYHNVFYDNAGGAIITGRSNDPAHFGDNIIKNNIMMNNRVIPLGWADNLDSGHQLSHRDMANFIVDHNCIFTDILPIQDSIYVSYDTRMSVSGVQNTESFRDLYMDNVVLDPTFEDASSHKFLLQDGSQMIDAGSFLTTAVGSGTQSNELVVADAIYFSDGFGIKNGDLIQFEGQTERVEVVGIDFATNTLTLNSAMSWDAGDGVALIYTGTSPDIGAFEYGSTITDRQAPTPPGNPTAAPISSTQMSLTWTASTDNVGVDFYNIFRCTGDCTPTAVIGTTTQTSYTDTDLISSTQYTYQLSAVDTSGNVSVRTSTFTATTDNADDSGTGGDDGGGGDGGDDGGGGGGDDGGSSGCFISTSLQHK